MDSRFSVLSRWKLRPNAELHAIGGGFSGAIVFKTTCEEGFFALRGWPVGTDHQRLTALHRLLVHVARSDVPVAVPLCGVDGQRLQWHFERWWQVEPWLPGEASFRTAPARSKLVAAMSALARFHIAASSFRSDDDTDEWFGGRAFGIAATVKDRRRIVEQRLLGDELVALRQQVSRSDAGSFTRLARRVLFHIDVLKEMLHRELSRAELFEVPLVPVLRDVWHDHVLFTGDRVTGLVDPSACRRDTVAADLSRLLGSMLRDDRADWEFAIECYQEHRRLTGNELQLIPILDRSGVLLSATNWVRRHYLDGVDCDTPAVLARLGDLVERLEVVS